MMNFVFKNKELCIENKELCIYQLESGLRILAEQPVWSVQGLQ